MIRTSCREIAEWWYEYAVKLYKCGKLNHAPLFAQRLFIDMGEPNCWGCDRQLGHDITDDKTSWEDILNNYNKLPVDRCHIIPAARGGSDEPNNLVLLCRECHRVSPDTTNPRYFFKWLNNRPKQFRDSVIRDIQDAAQQLGFSFEMAILVLIIPGILGEERKWSDFSVGISVPHYMEYALTSEIVTKEIYIKKFHKDIYGKILSASYQETMNYVLDMAIAKRDYV